MSPDFFNGLAPQAFQILLITSLRIQKQSSKDKNGGAKHVEHVSFGTSLTTQPKLSGGVPTPSTLVYSLPNGFM
jgi:hypothetical protein